MKLYKKIKQSRKSQDRVCMISVKEIVFKRGPAEKIWSVPRVTQKNNPKNNVFMTASITVQNLP